MKAQYHQQAVIIGAGMIGLGVASRLSADGYDCLMIEKNDRAGNGITARNSQVIHAGIYYATNSAKAEFCVQGKQMLYEFAKKYHVPYRKTGKLIVATHEDELPMLEKIHQQAVKNGVEDLIELDQAQCQRKEPNLQAKAALLSPQTGIIDVPHLVQTHLAHLQDYQTMIAYQTEMVQMDYQENRFLLTCQYNDERMVISCDYLINCAGLHAVNMAKKMNFYPHEYIPQSRFAKGNYFQYHGKHPFKHLIYPVPEAGGLGVHLTLGMDGSCRFGPDVEWLEFDDADRIDANVYHVNDHKHGLFTDKIQRYFPTLQADKLCPDFAGIRPKIGWQKDKVSDDFFILSHANHGIVNLVQCFGIESPGMTSHLAIAQYIAKRLKYG